MESDGAVNALLYMCSNPALDGLFQEKHDVSDQDFQRLLVNGLTQERGFTGQFSPN